MLPSDREAGSTEPPTADGDGAAPWPPREAAPPGEAPKPDSGTQAEAKAEEKTEAKADEKAQAKADENTEAKADENTEAKADENTEAKADENTEAKADENTEAKADEKAQAKADEKTEAKADAAPAEPAPSESAAAAPSPRAAAQAEGGAALPAQEMPFSNSTLHWLDDGEESTRHEPTDTQITVPGYDPTAPVAGRRRAVLVVGGAGVIALLVTGVLKVMAPHHDAAAEATAADPARELTVRAQAAFDAHHVGEALELARLALVADPRFADAHFVLANCERAHNQVPGAREEYRRYLELAPLGTHAAAARDALASLPP